MTELNKMYEGVANSPDTFLTQPLASGGTIMYVADVSVFGTLPNLAVIGNGANAETILIKKKREDGGLDVDRGIEGKAKDWPKAITAARNFTNYDHGKFKENIEKLNKDKLEENSQIDFTEADKKENINGTDSIKSVFGKISKWFTDIKTIAWTGKLADAEEDEEHRLVTDGEKEKWNKELEKASQSEAETATDDDKYMTPLRTKDAIKKLSTKITKLSELEADETHRLVTDSEKEKWNKELERGKILQFQNEHGISIAYVKIGNFVCLSGEVLGNARDNIKLLPITIRPNHYIYRTYSGFEISIDDSGEITLSNNNNNDPNFSVTYHSFDISYISV